MSIYERAIELTRKNVKKKRKCLKCGTWFMSEGQRVCCYCHAENNQYGAIAQGVF